MIDFGRLVQPGRPFQVHIAPRFLEPDNRADQVFLGFNGKDLARFIGSRLNRNQVQIDEQSVEVLELQDITYSTAVVPSVEAENPGGLNGVRWLVDRLLGPGGCPWDQEQTHESLRKYLIEESYELIDAIDKADEAAMLEELGDVLLQPVMHAQMKHRDGDYDINRVADVLIEKLIRRHPHVFGDVDASDTATVLANWDKIKTAERKGKEEPSGLLTGVPKAMPALTRALAISKRAARAGFEWPDLDGVWAKFDEETGELKEAISGGKYEEIRDELGDLLFTVVNLARWLKVDPEEALRVMLNRFQERFEKMESMAEVPLSELNPEQWDSLWNQAKSGGTPAPSPAPEV